MCCGVKSRLRDEVIGEIKGMFRRTLSGGKKITSARDASAEKAMSEQNGRETQVIKLHSLVVPQRQKETIAERRRKTPKKEQSEQHERSSSSVDSCDSSNLNPINSQLAASQVSPRTQLHWP